MTHVKKCLIDKSNLDRHKKIHLKENLVCKVCSREYKRLDHYQEHQLVYTSKATSCKKKSSLNVPEFDFDITTAWNASLVTAFSNEEQYDLSELSMAFDEECGSQVSKVFRSYFQYKSYIYMC